MRTRFLKSCSNGEYPVHRSVVIFAEGLMWDFMKLPRDAELASGITLAYNLLTPFFFFSIPPTTSFLELFFLPRTPSSCPPKTVSSTSATPTIVYSLDLFIACMTLVLADQLDLCL